MATTPATDYENSGPSLDGILLAEELLDLAERAQAYTNAAGVAIALRRGQDLLVRTSTGSAPEVGSSIPAADAFIADCLRTRRPLCCRDTEADGRVGPVFRALKIRSLIAVPVCEHRDAKGVMIVISPVANAFQPTHTAILMTLSDIIASKLAARDAMPKTAGAPNMTAPSLPPPISDPAPVTYSQPAMPAVPPPIAAATPNYSAPVQPRQLEPMILPDHPEIPQTSSFAADSFPHISEVLSTPMADASPMDAPAIPADLLRTAPMPLPEEVHEEQQVDPSLLGPSEDPARFRRPISVSSTMTPRSPLMSVNSTPHAPTIKPAASRKPAASSQTMKPAAPAVKPGARKPSEMPAASLAAAASSASATPVLKPTPVVKPTIKPAAAVKSATPAARPIDEDAAVLAPVITFTAAADSWSSPVIAKQPRNKFMMFGSIAAALIVVGGLWMYMGATKEVAPPSGHAVQPAIPAATMPAAVAAAPTATPKLELVSKGNTTIEKSPKPVEVADTTKKVAAPVKVIELAAAKTHAQADVVEAPKLALASSADAVSTLSRLPVAMPSRPQSELVPATLVSRIAPTYPAMAKQLHIYGTVQMSITIATSGAVKDVKVQSGPAQLQAAAVEAVKRWKYKPAMLNGAPTESAAEVQVNFAR